MPIQVISRLPEIGTSIFSIMSKMAVDHQAINLSQGFPDFPVDETVIKLVHRFMLEGNNQYAPMPGTGELRAIIGETIQAAYSCTINPDTEITITAGATQGLFASISAFISSGDEVIVFDPSYDSYAPAIRLNGGIPVHINLSYPDFSVDWDAVEKTISARTKMIIVNTPHNPSGAVLDDRDLKNLERIALKHGILVLSDEVYERLIFDGVSHQSALKFSGLASQTIAVFSFGKTFHATGWKVGYTVAPEALTREIRKAHQFMVFSVNTPVQLALADYMKTPSHYLSLAEFYQRKRNFFLEQIKGSSFEPLPCKGSYFQVLSYKNVSDKTDLEMAEELTKKAKVASIPVSVFYNDKTDNRLLRFCFAKKEETLEKAGKILRQL